jgi:hypothetical protein
MKTHHVLAYASALALVAGSPSQAAPAPHAPTGKWVVDFAESQCLASRNYGPPGQPLYLVLKPSPMGQVMQISIVRKAKGGDAIQVPATLRFDEQEPIKSSMLAFTSSKDGVRINLVNLPIEAFAPARQAKGVSVRSAGELNESFALAQMAPLMAAIDRCVVSLQQHWNIGEANGAKLKERASSKANLATYVRNEDYPAVALQNREMGEVGFALLIDATGKIADCMVIATSGVASLDAQSCATMTSRAKFNPAIGTDGKPAKDALTARIRWVVGNRMPSRSGSDSR